MAIVNKYASANYNNTNGPKLDPAGSFGTGVDLQSSVCTFVMTGDTVASIYRIFKGIPGDAIITKLEIVNDVWTNCTSVNIGLYGVLDFDGVGAVTSNATVASGAALLVSAYDPHSATTDWTNMPLAMGVAAHGQPLWTLCGQSEYPPKFAAYDIGLATVTNSGTATPNLTFKLSYIRNV